MERFKISRILEEKHSTQIVLFIHACGPQSKSDIYRTISTNSRMPLKLEMLRDEGILEERRSGDGSCKTIYNLTPVGKILANMLCDMEHRLGGDLAPLKKEILRCVTDERSNRSRGW